MNTKKQIRCIGALERLEVQLKSGVKQKTLVSQSKYAWDIKNEIKSWGYPEDLKYTRIGDTKISVETPLTETDVKRIKKEIAVLKIKLKI